MRTHLIEQVTLTEPIKAEYLNNGTLDYGRADGSGRAEIRGMVSGDVLTHVQIDVDGEYETWQPMTLALDLVADCQ